MKYYGYEKKWERQIVSYQDLTKVKDADGNSACNKEKLVSLEERGFCLKPWSLDMKPYTGNDIFVRSGIVSNLLVAEEILSECSLRLLITYGYRHPDVQLRYFDEVVAGLRIKHENFSDEKLQEIAHNFIAVPSVAGHPTGGAVDVTLIDVQGIELDMGTKVAELSQAKKIPTFSELINTEQKKNRFILRAAMKRAGFAPFNGEWWHFSFGDKEWAFWNRGWDAFSGQLDGLQGPYPLKAMYQKISFTKKLTNEI